MLFGGLPVAGDIAEARQAGFTRCFNTDAVNVRCRRPVAMFYGHGPFEAAVDLRGREGQSGFDHLTIWHEDDQRALYAVVLSLYKAGWRSCHTGGEFSGDQAIFTRPGAPVRISIDISYYGDRRMRVFPTWRGQKMSSKCVPDEGLGIFNLNV